MGRSVWIRFAFFWVAAVAACGDESGSEVPDFDTTSPAAPGASGAGAGGAASVPATPVSGNAGQTATSETPNAGLDAPLDGAGETGGTNGAGDATPGAAAGATGGPEAMGGASGVGGSSAAGGAMASGGASSEPPPASPFPAGVTRPRLLIIGDSISAGPGCYKKYLLADLNAAGFTSFDFVGEYTDDCGGGVMHGARSCSTAQQYTQASFTLAAGSCNPSGTFPGLAALAAEHRPDLIMLQLGVNDVWGGMAIENVLASYTTLVQQARAQNPSIVLVVAQIQKIRPMDAGGDATFARTQQLIEAVPSWAAAQSQPGSPVFVADLWTNSDVAQTNDGVHPDDAGAQRMGQNWFAALSNILPRD